MPQRLDDGSYSLSEAATACLLRVYLVRLTSLRSKPSERLGIKADGDAAVSFRPMQIARPSPRDMASDVVFCIVFGIVFAPPPGEVSAGVAFVNGGTWRQTEFQRAASRRACQRRPAHVPGPKGPPVHGACDGRRRAEHQVVVRRPPGHMRLRCGVSQVRWRFRL
jgi:hypothetical protein